MDKESNRYMSRVKEQLQDLHRSEEEHRLLIAIWTDIGPYNQRPISEETLRKLNNLFRWDDSE